MEDPNQEPKIEDKIEFKKPVLFGRIGKLPKKVKRGVETAAKEIQVENPVENTPESSSKNILPPAVLLKELATPIPYKEPKWSGVCPDGKWLQAFYSLSHL